MGAKNPNHPLLILVLGNSWHTARFRGGGYRLIYKSFFYGGLAGIVASVLTGMALHFLREPATNDIGSGFLIIGAGIVVGCGVWLPLLAIGFMQVRNDPYDACLWCNRVHSGRCRDVKKEDEGRDRHA